MGRDRNINTSLTRALTSRLAVNPVARGGGGDERRIMSRSLSDIVEMLSRSLTVSMSQRQRHQSIVCTRVALLTAGPLRRTVLPP
ncbi:unnamed protein product [Parascedosporium putredinis]|uniref:Uncharacterized protein n=1 Tax=Parascedosporium putredinis TaxID=1442378 RepID=A0A9P1M8V7_9PEZI|nr:unnamed protein product [Parascedosporium putredinis]CAI7990665.1 unnamed protein product [Parascedosporium putredinis]